MFFFFMGEVTSDGRPCSPNLLVLLRRGDDMGGVYLFIGSFIIKERTRGKTGESERHEH